MSSDLQIPHIIVTSDHELSSIKIKIDGESSESENDDDEIVATGTWLRPRTNNLRC